MMTMAMAKTIPPHVTTLVSELRARLTVAEAAVLDCLDLVDQAIQGQVWTYYAYTDPGPWFEDVLRVRYDWLARRIRVLNGLRMLPTEDIDQARAAIAEMGPSRARHFAAVLHDETGRASWRDYLPDDDECVESYADRVFHDLGHTRRPASQPGDTFLKLILSRMPDDDVRAEVTRAFTVARRVAETENSIACFLAMAREFLATYPK